ncbi:MAG: hypothetical protein K1X82_05430 [Bacteroidia bacterium]|nr:hypothetical protein [Bacteroidia bacterium]
MNISKPFWIIVLCFLPGILRAGNENFQLGSRSAALGGASVCLSDIWSLGNNQAGLGYIKNISLGAYYDNKFLLKDLNTGAAAIAIPIKKLGVLGLCYTQTGSKLYRESKYGFAYARAFGEHISIGMQINYQSVFIGEGYNNRKGLFTGEIGIQAKVFRNLTLGAHVYNPTMTKMNDYNNERVPVIFKLGLLYRFSEKVFIAAEGEKDLDYRPYFKIGIEYMPVKQVFIRTGISTNPFQNGIGIGLKFGGLKIDVSSTIHPQLGVSPQMGLCYLFGKEIENPVKK